MLQFLFTMQRKLPFKDLFILYVNGKYGTIPIATLLLGLFLISQTLNEIDFAEISTKPKIDDN
ncbi:hypothetical protein AVL50_04415 [Flammeovirga sp. SJP92]|nr:hypothetical protein AVL50_04415 [Flammeovirga sp. SJP92]